MADIVSSQSLASIQYLHVMIDKKFTIIKSLTVNVVIHFIVRDSILKREL